MKKIINLLLVAIAAISVSSCALSHKVDFVPTTSLEKNNFEYVREVKTSATYTVILGFGGLIDKDLHKQLEKEANLQPGEALANIAVHKTVKSYIGVVVITKFNVSGSVVKFTDKPNETK